jgi:hypothetical protein
MGGDVAGAASHVAQVLARGFGHVADLLEHGRQPVGCAEDRFELPVIASHGYIQSFGFVFEGRYAHGLVLVALKVIERHTQDSLGVYAPEVRDFKGAVAQG